jgi:uncharacterized protein
VTFDCQRCGACCCNPAENRAEGYRDYVPVEAGSRLSRRLRILGRYTSLNAHGERHMKLVGAEERCAALEGRLGRSVSCAIYADRPAACKKIEAGSSRCVQYRRERGLDPIAVGSLGRMD